MHHKRSCGGEVHTQKTGNVTEAMLFPFGAQKTGDII